MLASTMRRRGTCNRWTSVGRQRARWAAVLTIASTAATGATAFEAGQPIEQWQIGQGQTAPWAGAGTAQPRGAVLTGQVVHLGTTRVTAPHPLGCAAAHYEYVVTPAEGLFQGRLPAPAERSARALGVRALPLLTLRLNCDGGVFDFHLLATDKALLGLDGVVWRLQRRVARPSPEAAVRDLLHLHFISDMGFSRATVARKRSHLSPDLARAIGAYFARPQSAHAAPAIDGDPFTDTQEYPGRFVVGRAVIDGASAQVVVSLGEAASARVVHVFLRNVGGRWRMDDLRYDDGRTLRQLLQP